MAIFQSAPKDVLALLKAVRAQFYRDLDETGVTISVLMAHAKKNEETGEPDGPALKHHGWPALASPGRRTAQGTALGSRRQYRQEPARPHVPLCRHVSR